MSLLSFFIAVTVLTTITLTPILVQGLTGVLIPILVGLVTKSGASASLKQGVTVVLAGVSGVITSSVVEGGFAVFSLETLLFAGLSWIIAIATYNGVYASHDLNEHLTPTRGIGSIETTASERY